VKGIIKTTTAIPKGAFFILFSGDIQMPRGMVGVMDIVQSIHEGFYNVPKLYGSEVREHGKVTNFTSGIKEGSKGLFYGYYDGITGLVREPLKGAKEEVRVYLSNSSTRYKQQLRDSSVPSKALQEAVGPFRTP
jgi:sterol 3beta-glucosyltransferase